MVDLVIGEQKIASYSARCSRGQWLDGEWNKPGPEVQPPVCSTLLQAPAAGGISAAGVVSVAGHGLVTRDGRGTGTGGGMAGNRHWAYLTPDPRCAGRSC